MNDTGTKFYVELPADEYGNTALPTAVIQATIAQHHGRPRLTILAPAEIAQKWPTRYADFYKGYAETEGPARLLSREDYDALIERIHAADWHGPECEDDEASLVAAQDSTGEEPQP